MRSWLCTVVCVLSLAGIFAQDNTLRNEDVVKMVGAGLGVDLIVTMISNSRCEFETDVDAILALKGKKVPEPIIQAMLEKSTVTPTLQRKDSGAGDPVTAAGTGDDGETLPTEVGVYYKDENGKLVRIEPEVVTWKTGGFLKSVATAGLNKGHVNGIVRKAVSAYKVNGTEDLFIYCVEGTSATEYQLLHLWEKKDQRTFRAITGGIVHSSGGAEKNLVYFEPVRVAPRIYRFKLPNLTTGEFGLLPPGAYGSASSASIGKIYSFSVAR